MKNKNKKRSCLIEKAESYRRLASVLAHKVNNPLTSVMNYVFLLKQDAGNANSQKMLARIERGVVKATEVLNGIVDLSSPSQEPAEELSLKACVDEVIESAQKGHPVVFKNRVDKSHVGIAGRQGLSKVIASLVENAVEAGAKHVAFEAEDEHGCLTLVVSDDGTGIGDEHFPMLFEPYFTTKPGRAGLGLFSAFNIVLSFGGLMWCESTPGEGARFFVASRKP